MPVQVQYESNSLCVVRFSGTLQQSEFGNVQDRTAEKIDAGIKPRVLALLENFTGWEKGADWNDIDYLLSHGNEVAKIAIVGEKRWEAEALAFAGAGFRRAPVKFFPTDQQAEARAWLAE